MLNQCNPSQNVLGVGCKGVIDFPNGGITGNLIDKAHQRGIPAMKGAAWAAPHQGAAPLRRRGPSYFARTPAAVPAPAFAGRGDVDCKDRADRDDNGDGRRDPGAGSSGGSLCDRAMHCNGFTGDFQCRLSRLRTLPALRVVFPPCRSCRMCAQDGARRARCRYAHLVDGHLVEAAEKVGQAIAKTMLLLG